MTLTAAFLTGIALAAIIVLGPEIYALLTVAHSLNP